MGKWVGRDKLRYRVRVPVADALQDRGIPRSWWRRTSPTLKRNWPPRATVENMLPTISVVFVWAPPGALRSRRVVDLLDVIPVFLGVVRVAGVLVGGAASSQLA